MEADGDVLDASRLAKRGCGVAQGQPKPPVSFLTKSPMPYACRFTQALSELVQEGWIELDDALELIEPLMHGNARQLFDLKRKEELLKQAPWL